MLDGLIKLKDRFTSACKFARAARTARIWCDNSNAPLNSSQNSVVERRRSRNNVYLHGWHYPYLCSDLIATLAGLDVYDFSHVAASMLFSVWQLFASLDSPLCAGIFKRRHCCLYSGPSVSSRQKPAAVGHCRGKGACLASRCGRPRDPDCLQPSNRPRRSLWHCITSQLHKPSMTGRPTDALTHRSMEGSGAAGFGRHNDQDIRWRFWTSCLILPTLYFS